MPDASKSEQFNMRASPEWLKSVDDWRRLQPEIPTRAEAIRRLVELGLQSAKAKKR